MKKLALILFAALGMINVNAQNPIYYLLVGTYTTGSKSEGIYVYRFNPNKGEATFVSKATGIPDPSYLCISKDQKFVYAVNETHGDKSGALSAYSFDKKKGELTLLNSQPTGGDDPCYVSIDSTGRNVIVANYNGGNITVFKTNTDGSLLPYTQLIAHEGYGVNVERQGMPHPHSVVFSPDEKYVFSADLGNDRLYQYNFKAGDSKPLTETATPYYTIEDGFGPRHFTFSPDGKFAYLMNELSGKIIVYGYDGTKLTELQTVVSDNTAAKGDKASADIHLSPNGKFLYSSNRGAANDITIYKTQTDGTLVEAGHQPVGAQPRNFMVDPTGRFLLAASQGGNTIQVFVINKNYGLLQDTGVKIDVEKPVCLQMVPVN